MPRWTEEQQLAIDKENTNIIVSAGAGSGKTAVLTARVMRKLKEGVHINELLILTFTNKAAFEMKERIRKSISENENLLSELDYLDSSYITTFDSFALSMVKKYYYLLNISKNVSIADSSIIYLEKKKALDEIFDSLYEEKNESFIKLVNDFTIKDDKDIKKYVLDINNKLDLKYDKKEYIKNYIDENYKDEHIDKIIKLYLNNIKAKLKKIDTLLTELSNEVEVDYFNEVSEALYELLNSNSYEQIRTSLNIKLPNLPRGSEENAKNIKKSITDIIDSIIELTRFEDIEEIKMTIKSTIPYIKAILDIIEKLDEKIDTYKNKNNIYEFTDISKMAIRILKENDTVKEELKYFFKEIMVDEYQDTSDLQEEFLRMIDNNNIYMVGDIKQSIYRFRNANPYLFKSKYDNYSQNRGGFKIDLTKNFRSRLEVIDNINLAFSILMTDDIGGANYIESHKMVFGNTTYIEEGKTEQENNLEIFDYEYDKDKGYSKEEIEAFIIANDIKTRVNNKYQIFDKDKKILRNANYGDFAILLDKSANFDLYKKIFEYLEIPMTKYVSTNIIKEQEIVLIKNILKLILSVKENNYDIEFKYAFISIARSYLFSYNDQQIFDYIADGNYNESLLMTYIKELTQKVDSTSLKEFIHLIIDKFDFYKKSIEIGDVKNRINRVTAIIDIFDNMANLEYTIYDIYEYLNELINDEYKLEIKESESLENSVKIMTIHASKGLEFPICYFASLHSQFNIRELNEKFLYSNKYGIITPYFKEGIGKTITKDLVRANYIQEEISEKVRLFYVALTRAKEKIIMVTSFDKDKKIDSMENARSFLDMLFFIKNNLENYIKKINLENIELTKNYNLIKQYNYEENIERTTDVIKLKKLDIENSETTRKKISKETTELIDKETKDKMKFGEEIHKILELLDFKNTNIEYLKISNFYKDKIKKFIEMINIKEIISIYKEYEFVYEENNSISHGFIDLILEYADELKIIDYKLKNIKDDNYINQLKCYKKYIQTKVDKDIRIYLFSITDGLLEEIK